MSASTFSLLPIKKHFPPVWFSRFISNSKRSHPAIRSLGWDFAFSHRHAITMLAPSGISTSPFIKASAKAASFNAVLYEWALIVFMSNLPPGKVFNDTLLSRIFKSFSLNISVFYLSDLSLFWDYLVIKRNHLEGFIFPRQLLLSFFTSF